MNKPVRNISVILILIVIAALLIIPKLLSESNSKQEGSGRGDRDQEVSADAFIIRHLPNSRIRYSPQNPFTLMKKYR
ncbi:MAG: hypothetical protein R2942_07330 [Ignavibacteria bacterium]